MDSTDRQTTDFEDPRSGIADRVRTLRARKDVSIRELALISGLNKDLVNAIELGNANPTILSLAKLAAGLGVDLKDLLDD